MLIYYVYSCYCIFYCLIFLVFLFECALWNTTKCIFNLKNEIPFRKLIYYFKKYFKKIFSYVKVTDPQNVINQEYFLHHGECHKYRKSLPVPKLEISMVLLHPQEKTLQTIEILYDRNSYRHRNETVH